MAYVSLGTPDLSSLGFTISTEDIDAIATYFANTRAVTSDAARVKEKFTSWYQNLGWFEKREESTLDQARNQRNLFNLANATTPEQLANVQRVIHTGVSLEQASGEQDRRLANGMLPGGLPDPGGDKASKYTMVALGVLAFGVVGTGGAMYVGQRKAAGYVAGGSVLGAGAIYLVGQIVKAMEPLTAAEEVAQKFGV